MQSGCAARLNGLLHRLEQNTHHWLQNGDEPRAAHQAYSGRRSSRLRAACFCRSLAQIRVSSAPTQCSRTRTQRPPHCMRARRLERHSPVYAHILGTVLAPRVNDKGNVLYSAGNRPKPTCPHHVDEHLSRRLCLTYQPQRGAGSLRSRDTFERGRSIYLLRFWARMASPTIAAKREGVH